LTTSNLITPNQKVLLIENDSAVRQELKNFLNLLEFEIHEATTAIHAFDLSNKFVYSLILIYISNPLDDNILLCKLLRAKSQVPILALTDQSKPISEDIILAAEANAYVTKPIDYDILKLKIDYQLNLSKNPLISSTDVLIWNELKLDLSKYSFEVNGNPVHLTRTEFEILALLMQSPLQVFSREQILDSIGSGSGIGSNQILDTHISRMRRKIRENGGPIVPWAIRSVGYRLDSLMTPEN
jgi:DNA-binding response OmpR family regulator